MNTLRTLAAEARWRGLWGTVRAIKMHRLGSKPYLVGEDEAGNRFFNNPALPAGRDRWVEYAEAKNFDAVKIAPEWYVARRVGVVVFRVLRVVGRRDWSWAFRLGRPVGRLALRAWARAAPRWPPPHLNPFAGHGRRRCAPRRSVVAPR